MSSDLYTLREGRAPRARLVVSIPHAGVAVPDEIAAQFSSPAIAALPMTDWHLGELYACLPALGVDVLIANVSRFVADLNRSPDAVALYPGRFETGLVALQTFTGEPVYSTPPTATEIETRRRVWHAPYHDCLTTLLAQRSAQCAGPLVLIDAHSVASGGNRIHGPLEDEIYLGDRDGQSCPAWLTDTVAELFTAAGFKVARNAPYKGGYTTAHYGQQEHVHALQIEMCQRVYMDENAPQGAPERPLFGVAQQRLQGIFAALCEAVRQRLPTEGV